VEAQLDFSMPFGSYEKSQSDVITGAISKITRPTKWWMDFGH
jgi:hypothetical protein